MIVWQLSLSGHALRTLVLIREGNWHDIEHRTVPDHFVTWVRSLKREKLISHEAPCNCDGPPSWWRDSVMPEDSLWREGQHWHEKGRKATFEITHKGELALELAAEDIGDFLEEVRAEILPPAKRGLIDRIKGK